MILTSELLPEDLDVKGGKGSRIAEYDGSGIDEEAESDKDE